MSVALDSMSPDKVYDVLIAGAGPVGLATAIALRKRGINNILVLEQTRSFRRVGQVVDLLPNGLKALKYIDEQAYQQVKENEFKLLQPPHKKNSDNQNIKVKDIKSPQKRAWHQKNLQGKITRSTPLDFEYWFNRYGEGRVSISWYDLQTTLRNLLPPEVVLANHCCINVTQANEYIEVTSISDRAITSNPFAHWEMQKSAPTYNHTQDELKNSKSIQKQFRAKLVVAADGINSTIRQVLYANSNLSSWAKPQYSGVAAIGCLQIDDLPNETIQELEANYFQGDRVITLRDDSNKSNAQDLKKPRIILIRQQENTCGYLLHTPLSLDLISNKSSAEIVSVAVDVLAKDDFPSSVIKLVSLSTSEGLFYRPYYLHPANIPVDSQPIWSNGRLVLAGDAAHGMPPFAAQGANQGFEDAALISTLITKLVHNNALDDEKMIASKFTMYEQIRRPFMSKIQFATMDNHHWSQDEWDNYGDMVYSRDLEQLFSDFC